MYRVLCELLPEDRFESGAPTRSAAPPTGPVQRQQFLPVHLLVLTPPPTGPVQRQQFLPVHLLVLTPPPTGLSSVNNSCRCTSSS